MNTREALFTVAGPLVFYGLSRLIWRGGGYHGSHRLATWIGVIGLFLTGLVGSLE